MITDIGSDATAGRAASVAAKLRSPLADQTGMGAGRALSDLAPRVLSALALIPLALACAWAGGPWLAGATGAAVVIMSFEWSRMSAPSRLGRTWATAFVAAFGGVVLSSWGAMGMAWVWLGGWALAAAALAGPGRSRAEQLLGVMYIAAPPALFLWLRQLDPGGAGAILALFTVIWSADVAGYFAGRLIGGARFAPVISPSKTWAGVIASLGFGALAGLGCALALGGPLGLWVVVGTGLAGVGLAGDLLESLIKRRFGVKDASRIIPGHGGMLDRLDGMMTATVAAAAMAWLAPDVVAVLTGHGG